MGNPWSFKCECCGRFIKHSELCRGGGASWVFVPSTHMTHEEDRYRCKECTKTHGKITPIQTVREDMCCGVC